MKDSSSPGSPRRATQPPALENIIVTREREIADGFGVRRALPSARRRMVGTLIFLDQMGLLCNMEPDAPREE
jgi:hypothetical protein